MENLKTTLSQSEENQNQIITYLEEQFQSQDDMIDGYPEEAVEFVILAIEALKDGIFENFEEAYQLFSDMDKECQANQIISFTTQTDSPIVNLITNNFFGNSTYNLQLEDVDLDPSLDGNAATIPPAGMIFSENTEVLIRFDNAYLNTATDLSIAMSTAHEFVHIYLMYLFSTGELLTYYPDYNDMDIAFENFQNNPSDITAEALDLEMHAQYDDFLDWITQSVFTHAANNNIDGATLEYCNKMVIGSYQNTEAFQGLQSELQSEYSQIAVNEQEGNEEAKGTSCE